MFKLTKKRIEIGGFDIGDLGKRVMLRKDTFKDFSTFIHFRTHFSKPRKDGNFIYDKVTGFIKYNSETGLDDFVVEKQALFIKPSQIEIEKLFKLHLEEVLVEGYSKDEEMYIHTEGEPVYRGNYASYEEREEKEEEWQEAEEVKPKLLGILKQSNKFPFLRLGPPKTINNQINTNNQP